MRPQNAEVVDLAAEANSSARYNNHPITELNDHVVRISVMTEPYHWHYHPDSDETFLVVEGRLRIDFETHSIDLGEGQLLTVRSGIRHRTLPIGGRSVNLTIERIKTDTIRVDAAPSASP
ncbi:MAG: cupin domain-containing protein [Candidatus Acidiferrum sp.]|jgi:mannose-6-phosphate isomerase-like protein (cupin superfamily)